MTHATATTYRSGQSNVPHSEARIYTLLVSVADRPGSIDRVIGLLRRRRANLQTLTLARSDQPDVMRLVAMVSDSEVGVDHLVEQLRKVFDVRQAEILEMGQAVVHELALVRIDNATGRFAEVNEAAHRNGAYAVDVAQDTITFEVVGSLEKIDQFVDQMQRYGIREIARSGSVMMARATSSK
ncbi:MAG TPA: acetolactate synthase small subunit [Ktedonobacteraceae bacterium]|jgi:acetolactate synthase-1/3 small subunit|nr:acetolactate synthase small subunit [Ktedonobacteraceae bacterium]